LDDATPADSARVTARSRRSAIGLAVLGPGLITGAADDDPSGIATYSQVGAQYGYGMGWTWSSPIR
jgi:Mn2+/Fe2+ NRAMP family transporter